MNMPLLSIVIPTHNRARYAVHSIKSLLAITDIRLEVVVSDTSTDGELATALAGAHRDLQADKRLKYFCPPGRLDMTGNHNFALAAATGDYVCLIGDDDTIAPEAILAAAWASDNHVDVIAPEVVANYAWLDFRSRFYGAGHAARLYLARAFVGWRWIDAATALDGALKNAGQGTDGLPKIYHGIVRRSVLERMSNGSGVYFHGSSPDVSGAIGLAAVCSRFLVVQYPLTIPGASGGSNTGRSALNQHKGKLSNETQTQAFVDKGWSKGVPRFFSVETVWAHAALETLTQLAPLRLSEFNFARLIGVCTELHGEYRTEIDAAIEEICMLLGTSMVDFRARIRAERWKFKWSRFSHLARRALRPTAAGGRQHVDGLSTIAEAVPALQQVLQARCQNWDQFSAQISLAGYLSSDASLR
ncbi:MAG: glycosyltransferase family 2 protein [Cytophagales bacterium]|nr:glycosyltransferase family 2 protein [Cytophagales bacterium]